MSTDAPLDLDSTSTESSGTEVGSYFISNYPPFSLWTGDQAPIAKERFASPPETDDPLGIYLHIPFCRKRCKFCYFRVYTKQSAKDIENYVQAVLKETEMVTRQPGMADRPLKFVYIGGGTPSYLSSRQLRSLRDRMSEYLTWDNAEEVTFECEPGTLSRDKVETLRDIGITRVSLGVENFNDTILEANGRAHLSPEVHTAYEWVQDVGFPQVNLDLIAGMIGETEENWQDCVEKIAEMSPDNITIYQMELPHNTVISKEMKETGIDSPIADWATKRRWVSEAMDYLTERGYEISSGNELVKSRETDRFVYRDNVWRGCDLIALGVSSFGHFQGVHYQNLDQLHDYIDTVQSGELPINRAMQPSPHQLLIREFVLQMKEGEVAFAPFRDKFGVDPAEEFAVPLANQERAGYLKVHDDRLTLTRRGLLQVDSLLPEYFEPEHRAVRYT